LRSDETTTLADAEVEQILTRGSLELEGRLLSASNASFLGEVTLDGVTLRCIYKPVKGERPLWDFPDGTLAGRERAARLVSEAGGWGVVPPTVVRDGPLGVGMCQRWIEVKPDHELVDVVPTEFDESGWIAILQAEDHLGQPVLLVHRDDDRLRRMSVLDVVINNADRKGGHVLVAPDERVFGCDHGVSFHAETKLRTVLWGWADEPLRQVDLQMLENLTDAFGAGLDDELATLITGTEIAALHLRVDLLRTLSVMPSPEGRWPAIPWPAF
jgi:uncharacterized repeat protein (TIGR03843 family)